jgi:hypothetical protein
VGIIATAPFFCSLSTASAEARAACVERLKLIEEVKQPIQPVTCSIEDRRALESHNFSLHVLEDLLADSLKARGYQATHIGGAWQLDTFKVILAVSYFGTYRSLTGKWGIRAAADLEWSDSRSGSRGEIPSTVDRLYGRRNDQGKERWESVLAGLFTTKVLQAITKVAGDQSTRLREVVSLGAAPLDRRPDGHLQSEKGAIMDALRSACERAWGIDVTGSAKLQDLQDYSETITRIGSCRVLGYELLKQYTTKTDDNFLVVMVRAVTARE